MPKNLTGLSQFTTPVIVPTGGDARSAESVEAPFQHLTNRTQYLYDRAVGAFATGVNDPEGLVTAIPGASYYSSTESSYWHKATGTGNTGWLRMVHTAANGSVSVYDRATGASGDYDLQIRRIADISGGSNYGELRINTGSPVGDTAITLYGISDADHPGELHLRASNSDDTYLALMHGDDPALVPRGALWLGTPANPWAQIHATEVVAGGLSMPTGNTELGSGSFVTTSGSFIATAGYVSAEVRPRTVVAADLPAASGSTGSIFRRAAEALLPSSLVWSDGAVWRDLRSVRPGVMSDANRALAYSVESFVHIAAGVLTTTRAITIPVDAGVGEAYEVSSLDTTNYVTVNGYTVANLATHWRYVRFVHAGAGVWYFAGGTKV